MFNNSEENFYNIQLIHQEANFDEIIKARTSFMENHRKRMETVFFSAESLNENNEKIDKVLNELDNLLEDLS